MTFLKEEINIFNFNKLFLNISDFLNFKFNYNNFKIYNSIFISSIFIIFLFLRRVRYKNDINFFKNKAIIYNSYLDKGEIEFNLLEDRDLLEEELDNLKKEYFQEITPEGLVKMYYDSNLQSFIYYSDSQISFKYLEVVARLFVNENKCKNIFIDYKAELFKAKEIKLKSKDRNINTDNSKSIFAIKKNKKLSNYSSIYIVPERSNKYIKKGTIRDLEEITRLNNQEQENKKKIKQINFKDFKNKN